MERCLRSIADQTYQNIETIVVDSNSDDGTIEIAKRFNAQVYHAPSLSSARLEAITRSKGFYVFLVDSDQVVDKDAVSECVDLCQRYGFNAVTLFERALVIKNTTAERVMAYDKWLIHSNKDDDVIYGAAIPRFFQASLLDGIKIPPNLVAFDHNLLYAATSGRVRVGFLDTNIYHHEPSSWSEIARKFFRYGQYYSYAFSFDRKLVAFHSMPRRTYFSKSVLKEPNLIPGIAFLYCVKVVAAFCGTLTSVLDRWSTTVKQKRQE